MSHTSKFSVAICGGGIAGLSLACALARYPDISVDIFESSVEFTPFKGAGIGIWPRTWKILQDLGLEADFEAIALASSTPEGESLSFTYRKSDQPEGICYLICTMDQGHMHTFHRAQFQEALLKNISPSCQIHYSKRLDHYIADENQQVILHFTDGTTASCNILVGADGVKSPTRACLYRHPDSISAQSEQYIEPEYSGTDVYRSVVPNLDMNKIKEPMNYAGKDLCIVTYPIASGRMVNVSVYHFRDHLRGSKYEGPWTENVSMSEVHNITSFEDWEEEVQYWINSMQNPIKWAIHTVRKLPTFIGPNVALIGDAAHAYLPHQGVGAGQAIEDAYVLAELLGHPKCTLDTIPKALQMYDEMRRPWAHEVMGRCEFNGRCFGMNYDSFDFEKAPKEATELKLQEMGNIIQEKLRWCWSTTVQSSLSQTVKGMY